MKSLRECLRCWLALLVFLFTMTPLAILPGAGLLAWYFETGSLTPVVFLVVYVIVGLLLWESDLLL